MMVSTTASSPPLVVQSDDGSLIAIHHSVATFSSSSSSSQQASSGGVIRCYDGNVSAGTLKFTLRLPSPTSSSTNDDELVSTTKDDEEGNSKLLRKLIFISSSSGADSSSPPQPAYAYLCGMRDISSILIYDIERGVLASTINIRNEDDNSKDSQKKKKKRKSSIVMNGAVVCDIAATSNNNTLYALIYFPTSDGDDESISKKCRVYEYDLHNSNGQEPRLVRKIKVGSASLLSSSPGRSGGSSTPSFGIHVSTTTSTLIVRLGNVLRVLDLTTGSRLAKVDIPPPSSNSNSNNSSNLGGSLLIPSFVPLCVSKDGRHVVTPVDNDRVALFSYYDKSKLRTMTTLSTNSAATTAGAEDAAIADIDMTYLDSGKKLVVSALLAGTAYIFEINLEDVTTTSSVPQMPYMPMVKLQTSNKDSPSPNMNLVSAKFHPRTPETTTILCLFQRSAMANRGGSVAGTGTTTLPMETVPYVGIKGTVIVGTSILTKNTDIVTTDGTTTKSSRKRKVEGGSVALASGDQGREASMAADLSSLQKKKKKGDANYDDDDDDKEKVAEEGDKKKETEDANDDNIEEEEEDGEQGQTIAERLALLSSAMEESDDDDDDEEEGDGPSSSTMTTTDKSKFSTKSATSATLTTLLTQALSSNDPTQLNVALQVTDRRLVEGTVLALQSLDAERGNNDNEEDPITAGYIPTLMAHLVRRMARRHSLVMKLGVWIKAILAATARSATYHVIRGGGGGDKNDDAVAERMAREGREMAMKLGPLKNFLNERVECFPQLLRLEGRLSLLNQQL